jgi:hypothetical protein
MKRKSLVVSEETHRKVKQIAANLSVSAEIVTDQLITPQIARVESGKLKIRIKPKQKD